MGGSLLLYTDRKETKYNIDMKESIKNNELQERQGYATPSVKVITTSVRRVICTSPGSVSDPFDNTEEEDI